MSTAFAARPLQLTNKTQSALVTGVCATIYSWPIFDQAPWPAKTLFGTSFIFCLVSIRKALQQTYILRRLTLHGMTTPEMADKIRIQLANKNKDGHWVPCRIQQMIWNSSILFLNLALLTLVAGYVWTILAAAYRVRFDASKDDTRVRKRTAHILSSTNICSADCCSHDHRGRPLGCTLCRFWIHHILSIHGACRGAEWRQCGGAGLIGATSGCEYEVGAIPSILE